MGTLIVTWLVRYGHVLSGGLWVGGYALLAMVVMPRLQREVTAPLLSVTIAAVRLLTYVGTATILFGLLLITRTRGFATIMRGGEWSGIVISCLVIAIALLGIGDGVLRPALKRADKAGSLRRAQRWCWLALILSVLAIGLMTRAIYAIS
ncbi:MAG: hypothetical protein R3E79_55115 [Caldilineaceae bacterium]